MSKLKTMNVVAKFSQSNEKAGALVKAIQDYAKHSLKDRFSEAGLSVAQFSGIDATYTKDEKALRINESFKEILQERSNVTLASYDNDIHEFAHAPSVAAMEQYLKKVMVEAIKPIVVNATGLSMIAEIQFLEYGGVAEFELESKKPYAVSEIGDRQKHTDAQERIKTSKTVTKIYKTLKIA